VAFDSAETSPRDRLVILRDFLAGLPDERFDMSRWARDARDNGVAPDTLLHNCGTAGCIVGWACALFATRAELDGYDAFWLAAEKLGLRPSVADKLFEPSAPQGFEGGLGEYWATLSRDQAVATLTRLIETKRAGRSRVDWRAPIRAIPAPAKVST
jgi:hypothetical protein